jgi:hypothetical protein
MDAMLYVGHENLAVVGESNYQNPLWAFVRASGADTKQRVRVKHYVILAAEPTNPFDPNAVSVWLNGEKVCEAEIGSSRASAHAPHEEDAGSDDERADDEIEDIAIHILAPIAGRSDRSRSLTATSGHAIARTGRAAPGQN